MKVKPKLMNEIEKKYDILKSVEGSGDYILPRAFYRQKALKWMATAHAADQTYIDRAVQYAMSEKARTYSTRYTKKHLKKAQKMMGRIWAEFASSDELTHPTTIGCINNIILNNGDADPKVPNIYRRCDVELYECPYHPPSFDEVSYLMYELLQEQNERIKSGNIRDVIESAIELNWGLIVIQPYKNGNKRTARMVQGLVLDKFGIPIPIVDFDERDHFFDLLLKDALHVFGTPDRNKPHFPDSNFANFLASKINTTLDRILYEPI